MAPTAIVVPASQPHGELLLRAECEAARMAYDPAAAQLILSADASVEEEVFVYKRNVVWSAGDCVRKRFTANAEVLQV